MSEEQKCEFEQRRLAVIRKHIEHDPKLRAVRRKHRQSVLLSVVGSFVVLGVALVLIKGFVIAHEGPQGYARMIAPTLQRQPQDSVIDLMLRPDPASTAIAATLAPVLQRATNASVATAPLAATQDQTPSLRDRFEQR